jgi:transcriptional regulator with XRE-family HTH domain
MTREATFGDLLRQYRRAAGLTQEELADRARLSPRAISDLERGARNRPWRETIELIAKALELGPSEREKLEAAARATDPVPAPAPSRLPARLTPLIGRKGEIDRVGNLLRRAERQVCEPARHIPRRAVGLRRRRRDGGEDWS